MKNMPLVLIAGWGHAPAAMLPLQSALSGYTCQLTSTNTLWHAQTHATLPHLPGLSRYATGLHNLLTPFGGRMNVIGWSMGGIVALETALACPSLIQRLVIISGTAHFCAGRGEFPGIGSAVLRAMARGLRRTPQDVMTTYYQNVHAPKREQWATQPNQAIDQHACDELLQGLNYLQHMDLQDNLARLMQPTLVLHGRKDCIVPWQAGEWLSHALATSYWHGYENYGHALPLQAPLLLAADIHAFLEDAT